MQTGAGRIERELADWNSHTASALIAQAENALTVAHDDRFDTVKSGIAEDVADTIPQRKTEKQATRFAEYTAKLLTAEADGGGIDNRHHLFDVPGQQRVEKSLVGVL